MLRKLWNDWVYPSIIIMVFVLLCARGCAGWFDGYSM